MSDFLAELKRRQIFRVAAAYAVVAWLGLQVVTNLTPALKLPDWASSLVVVLLIVGFPIALLFAWTIELKTPAGSDGPAASARTTNVDYVLIGAIGLVIAMFAYQQISYRPVAGTAESAQPTVETAREAAASPAGAISIAVLPFANLSGDASQGFFSDGMTEEITASLARIPDLRVVARTSAYQFRDQNRDIQSIGQQLRATHFIEGSVRKAGDRVRITAQLIKADDGTHIWAENYERELTDVFAIQEEIARSIATSLRMPLGGRPGENLVSSRAIDPESHQQFLRAKALVSLRARGMPQAIEILVPLVARNPDYAPAWALLASAYGLTPGFHRNDPLAEMKRLVADVEPKAEAAAQRAIALDPNLAEGYLALSRVHAASGNYLQADELRRKALALDSNHPDALQAHSNWLATAGHLKEALRLKQHLRSLEPLVPNYNTDLAEFLWLDGQTDAAVAMFKELPEGDAKTGLATIYAAQGRYNEAADVLLELQKGVPSQAAGTIAEAARLLRTAPTVSASPQSLAPLGTVAFVYLHVGAPARILEPYEGWADAGYVVDPGFPRLWHSSYAPVRKLERFKAYVRKAGFVDYWRAKGWPAFCRPIGADDFQCE